jgi:hypothetical protein
MNITAEQIVAIAATGFVLVINTVGTWIGIRTHRMTRRVAAECGFPPPSRSRNWTVPVLVALWLVCIAGFIATIWLAFSG